MSLCSVVQNNLAEVIGIIVYLRHFLMLRLLPFFQVRSLKQLFYKQISCIHSFIFSILLEDFRLLLFVALNRKHKLVFVYVVILKLIIISLYVYYRLLILNIDFVDFRIHYFQLLPLNLASIFTNYFGIMHYQVIQFCFLLLLLFLANFKYLFVVYLYLIFALQQFDLLQKFLFNSFYNE